MAVCEICMAFSPYVALAVRLTPSWLVQRVANEVFQNVMRLHPSILDRLGDFKDRSFGFCLTDFSISFLVRPMRRRLEVRFDLADGAADATISGPLHLLLSLAEGRYDADALFFSRDLTVTGDMEAMLALRNALDDCHLDLPTDIGSLAGPFGPMVKRLAEHTRKRVLGSEELKWN